MIGTRLRVPTGKDVELFRALSLTRIVDRHHACAITGRADVSISTSNAWLLKLVEGGLLRRFFIATESGGIKSLYSLTQRSAAIAGVPFRPVLRKTDSVLISDQFVQHQLAVNDLFIQVKYRPLPIEDAETLRWIRFTGPISHRVPLIPDGYFELKVGTEVHSMFCEVDRGTEAQKAWTKKARLYLELALTGEFERAFQGKRFRVLVVALSERRLTQIRKTVRQETQKLFWFTTLNAINREGMFASHWVRPVGDSKLSLL